MSTPGKQGHVGQQEAERRGLPLWLQASGMGFVYLEGPPGIIPGVGTATLMSLQTDLAKGVGEHVLGSPRVCEQPANMDVQVGLAFLHVAMKQKAQQKHTCTENPEIINLTRGPGPDLIFVGTGSRSYL